MRALPVAGMRARAADLRAVFAIRPFAIYQAGNAAMTAGFWMQRVAVGWAMWRLTGSEAWLGLVAFAELAPSILTAIMGGILTDRHSGPRVMVWGQIGALSVPVALTALAAAGALTQWNLVWLMAALGAVSGAMLPARLSMAAHLAPPELLPTALAVNATVFNLSRFVGPALAAGLLVWGSETLVFAAASLGFAGFAVALWAIRGVPRQSPGRAAGAPAGTLTVLRDVARAPLVRTVILLQLAAGLLVRPASELFPAFADIAFGRGAGGLGALNAALGAGAILGALAFARPRETASAMRQILGMSALFAGSLVAFALTGALALALAILVVHGVAMAAANVAALSFVQINTAPERLGRVLSLYAIVFRTGPAVGAFLFGLAAEVAGLAATGTAFGLAGLAVVALSALALATGARRRT